MRLSAEASKGQAKKHPPAGLCHVGQVLALAAQQRDLQANGWAESDGKDQVLLPGEGGRGTLSESSARRSSQRAIPPFPSHAGLTGSHPPRSIERGPASSPGRS